MPLNAYQQAVSNLAKSLGLKGAAESQVYQRPEYLALVKQLYGEIPLPPGVDPSQVTKNDGAVLEYTDAQGYVHRLERDLQGTSSTLGEVRESGTNRPPVLPPPPQQREGEQNVINTALAQLFQRFNQQPLVPNAPSPPDLSGLYRQYGFLGQQLGQFQNAPTPPDLAGVMSGLSGLQGQFGGLQQSFQDVVSRLMQPAQLAQLTGSDLSNLSAIKAATDAQLNQQFQAGQSNLLTRLYGQGVNQSTIANQASADLLQAQGILQLQSNADAAARQLALQQFITQTGQGNLALAGQTIGQQGQSLGQLASALLGQGQLQLGQGQLALGGYEAQNNARLNALNLFGNMLGQQGQLALGQGNQALAGYSAQQGATSDAYSQLLSAFNSLANLDLNRQVSSGQLGLGQAQLAEQIRQANIQNSQFQEQLRFQERAARDAFTRSLIMGGIGLGGSLLTGGLAGLFGGAGAGAASAGGNALGNTGSILSSAAMRGTQPIFR